MSQTMQKQVVSRLKRIPCQQQNCRNQNLDNIEVIVFGFGQDKQSNPKKSGLMCSECLLDSQLLNQIQPIERHSISISKFMRTLTEKYLEYAAEKNAITWGPNILEEEKKEIKEMMSANEQLLFKGLKEVMTFVEDSEALALEQIKALYREKNFEQLNDLLQEEDEDEQERINVGKEIKEISSMLLQVEGEVKLSNESEIKQKHENILFEYRKKIEMAKECIEKLIEVQKRCLKQLIK